jgi:membrane-associated protease RseP (regulator of RpoE activity)
LCWPSPLASASPVEDRPLDAQPKEYFELQSPCSSSGFPTAQGSDAGREDLFLHPMAFAGWAGLPVTALNLLPIGQLDGGHVIYSSRSPGQDVCPCWWRWRSGLAIFYNLSYILFAGIAFLMRHHPPTWDDSLPITPGRRLIGILLLLMFFLCFTPKPF